VSPRYPTFEELVLQDAYSAHKQLLLSGIESKVEDHLEASRKFLLSRECAVIEYVTDHHYPCPIDEFWCWYDHYMKVGVPTDA